jgi:hypothetical protein
MIGGVVANNSSGMCCGVSQNTYHTLKVRCWDRTQLADGDRAEQQQQQQQQRRVDAGCACVNDVSVFQLILCLASPAGAAVLSCCVRPSTYSTSPDYIFSRCCLQDMRVVFVDGTVLDTADPNSRESFLRVSWQQQQEQW